MHHVLLHTIHLHHHLMKVPLLAASPGGLDCSAVDGRIHHAECG